MHNFSDTSGKVIGSKELVDFPELGLVGVPAKVDTGADSSAIWASKIKVKDNSLNFVLFDKQSIYYTGKKLVSRDFSVSVVKNSFGHAEFRYKVRFKIKVAGRTVNAKFTLANRENNRFPILLGRRTIHGRFLVDVAMSSATTEARMLFLEAKNLQLIEKFANSVEKLSKKSTINAALYDDIMFFIGKKTLKVCQISTKTDIAKYDIVYFKSFTNKLLPISSAISIYLRYKGVKFNSSTATQVLNLSKLQQYMVLACNDVMVPDSIFVMPSVLGQHYELFRDKLGLPFILKDIDGQKGRDNFLIDSEVTFRKICEYAKQKDLLLIAQRFIDNDCDYRVLVLGRNVGLIIKRTRKTGSTHINNVSSGAEVEVISKKALPTKITTMCLEAAKLLDCRVAGVDIVQDKNSGLWYCLEVNDPPQIATGVFKAEKLAAFAKYLDSEIK